MEETLLKAVHRNVIGKQVKALRREGMLPAVLYGKHIDPIPLSLDAREADRVLSNISLSTLVTIDLEGNRYPALIRERQRNVIAGNIIHVDFLAITMSEKLRANVAIEFEGEAPATLDLGGYLVTGVSELAVECLPSDLPERVLVDVSGLKEIGDTIYVRDIVVPDNVEILDEPDTMVVLIASRAVPVEEEEEEELEEELEEPKVIERGRREEEIE